jgi:dihydrolipoamide dehydrogenase
MVMADKDVFDLIVTGAGPAGQVWHAVPAFPTTSEIWLRLLLAYGL